MTRPRLLLFTASLFLVGCPASETADPDSRIQDGPPPAKEGGTNKDGATADLAQQDKGKQDAQIKPDLKVKQDQMPVKDVALPDAKVPDKMVPDQAVPDQAVPDQKPASKFGTHCTSKAGCAANQICLAVVPPGPSGYCTQKCSPSGSVCPGAPAGMLARCSWPGGPSIYYCVFRCQDGATTYPCPPKHKCATNGRCTPL